MPKVLIIEDDPTIRTAVMRALTDKGYAVAAAHTAMSGLQLAMSEYPDVVVLDLGLPDLDGREVIRMLRAVSEVPVIVATARESEAEIVRSLDAGADDYLVKPFGAAQLDARIRAVLRRAAEPPAEAVIEVGGLRVDRRARQASLDGAALDLTPREFDLLHYLAVRAGTVVTKQELLVEVWQQPYGGADKSVDVHLSWLRRKLGETAQQPRYLHTVRRVGVRLAAPDAPGAPPPRGAGAGVPGATPAPEPGRRPHRRPLGETPPGLPGLRHHGPGAGGLRRAAGHPGPGDRGGPRGVLRHQCGPAAVRRGRRGPDGRLAAHVGDAAGRSSSRPVTVFQGSGPAIGSPARRTASVQLAQRTQSSFTVAVPGGREILVAVAGAPGGTAVVRTFVSNAELTHGVTQAWLILAGLGLVLLALGVAIAIRLAGTVTRPIAELARVSQRLADGDLEARADPAGPPEVREVAGSLNYLAGRIRELIWQDRETFADLSHRLRTPLTALRLEAEAADYGDPDGRLHHRRPGPGAGGDLADRGRPAARWPAGLLRRREGHRGTGRVLVRAGRRPGQGDDGADTGEPVPVGLAAADLAASLDVLLGNVFAHTPEGAGFTIRLIARPEGGGELGVLDTGPGFDPAKDPVQRGASGGGSTGLGLDIARQAAEASGGSLTIRNGPHGAEVVAAFGPPRQARADGRAP